MEKIEKKLAKMLAYEERLSIYCLIKNKEIQEEDIENYMYMIEFLTKLNLTTEGFDYETISLLGIDNCCNFFEALCRQYSMHVNPDDEFASYVAYDEKFDVRIPGVFCGGISKRASVGLYDAASFIDKTIDTNYEVLKNDVFSNNLDDIVYKYARAWTFSHMYLHIRDFIEGETYFDTDLMQSYRILSLEHKKQSDDLIGDFARVEGISIVDAKKKLLDTLNNGVALLVNAPIKTTANVEKNLLLRK